MVKPLEEIDLWIRSNRPGYYAELQPGVSDEQLNRFEQQFSVKLPAAFRELYRWKNGQPNSCSDSFVENRMFTPLEDMAETKKELDAMIGTDFEDPTTWRRGWIPFLSNGGGDHLCLDMGAEDGGAIGQLIAYWHADEDRPIEFPSTEAWLQEISGQMKDGTFEVVS